VAVVKIVEGDAAVLANQITRHFPAWHVIGVDDWLGAGKTRLADSLASLLTSAFYDLDEEPNDPGKFEYLTAKRLEAAPQRLAAARNSRIVSGVMMRRAMA
jgi:hypothetical protein